MSSVHLTTENVSEIIEDIDTFLFDCDGVIWKDTEVIPGVPEALDSLRKRGKRVLFVSNNSTRTRPEYTAKMAKMGISAKPEEVFGTAYATAHYLQKHSKGKVYVVAGEPLKKELDARNVPCFGPGLDPVDDEGVRALPSHLTTLPLDPEVKTVCVGYDPHLNIIKLTKAINYLQDPDCLFVGTNTDRSLPNPTSRLIAGTGCFVEFVARTANREPTYVGKPFTPIFDCICEECSAAGQPIDPARTCMIGDNPLTDIPFGNRHGMKTLLVFTGHGTREDLESLAAEDDRRPTYFTDTAAVLSCS
ncbi:glycerol-3-phosphate phosphatase-like [Sycon ciliatum]|uniref:glycerol-3-phosphate phosphatase-like n=1 Tax=Sycon ciliatum TaxID=27933 RepID=UPI0020AC65D7|eukprot:scpid91440/ scgid10987/ Phosphoglycolate phosphatase